MENKLAGLRVPSLIMSPSDVSRLRREIEALDEYMEQQALRAPAGSQPLLPKTTRVLDQLATENKLNLADKTTRDHLRQFFADVAANAPVVQLSFSSEPSSAFMQKIVVWFRQNIHPSILVRVGLQPTLAAGCVVRTTNKYFDFSLRQFLKKREPELLAAIKAEEAR